MALAYFFMIVRIVPPVGDADPVLSDDAGHRPPGNLGLPSCSSTRCSISAFVGLDDVLLFPRLPASIEEAALTDGCDGMRRLRASVALPTARSGVVASAILCTHVFLERLSLRHVSHPLGDSKPISVALLSAYGTKDISWGTLGALAHFSTCPSS